MGPSTGNANTTLQDGETWVIRCPVRRDTASIDTCCMPCCHHHSKPPRTRWVVQSCGPSDSPRSLPCSSFYNARRRRPMPSIGLARNAKRTLTSTTRICAPSNHPHHSLESMPPTRTTVAPDGATTPPRLRATPLGDPQVL